MDGSNPQESEEQITKALVWDEMKTEKKIPYWYLNDCQRLTTAIHIITRYDEEVHEYDRDLDAGRQRDALPYSIFQLFNEALIEMLSYNPMTMKLKGAHVSYRMVYVKLHEHLKYVDDPKYGTFFDVQALLDVATADFELGCKHNAAQGTPIKNWLLYMKACVWNAMQTCNISVNSQSMS